MNIIIIFVLIIMCHYNENVVGTYHGVYIHTLKKKIFIYIWY